MAFPSSSTRKYEGRAGKLGLISDLHNKTQNYIPSLSGLYSEYVGGAQPTCIVTDKEGSLKNVLSLSPYFCGIPLIICQWHVEMNVANADVEKQRMRELREKFMARFEARLIGLKSFWH